MCVCVCMQRVMTACGSQVDAAAAVRRGVAHIFFCYRTHAHTYTHHKSRTRPNQYGRPILLPTPEEEEEEDDDDDASLLGSSSSSFSSSSSWCYDEEEDGEEEAVAAAAGEEEEKGPGQQQQQQQQQQQRLQQQQSAPRTPPPVVRAPAVVLGEGDGSATASPLIFQAPPSGRQVRCFCWFVSVLVRDCWGWGQGGG
jgi:hypothetical protein